MGTRYSTVQFQGGRLIVKGSNGYAMPVAELSEGSIALDAEDAVLQSEDQVPELSMRKSLKVSIKAKIQRSMSSALHAAIAGGSVAVGSAKVVIENETHAAAGTVVVDNGATFSEDLGVKDNNGNWMEPIASAPAVGQYVPGAVGVGSYTFNAGETGTLHFYYVKTSTGGEVVSVSQQVQAESPVLTGWFYSSTKQPDGTTKKVARYFYKLVPTKLNEAQKRADYSESDIELTALAKADGKFYEIHAS